MAVIGVVTDDFTGTASAGVLVARSGADTGLFFDAQAVRDFKEADRLQAVYVSSNSRHLPPEKAYASVLETAGGLKSMGVQYYSKKIDTTLRGGIGYEVDAMLELLGESYMAVMVTAMPASKRICVGGHSVIDGVILTETSAAEDVITPVKECYVPNLMESQSRHRVDLILLKDVMKGVEHLKKCMELSREDGRRILIVDAITMEHIDIIAKACVELKWDVLAVDPGPFTMKLAFHRGLIGGECSGENSRRKVKRDKTALFMVGSANPQTKEQIQRLCGANKKAVCIHAYPDRLIEGGVSAAAEISRVSGEAVKLFGAEEPPEAIIVETALGGPVINLKEEDVRRGYETGTSSGLINDGFARITEQVIDTAGRERIAGLLLTGGDTMESICRRIGVSCIQARDNIVAQVDVGKILGKYEGLPVVVKGGFCGYKDVMIDVLDRLFLEASR